MENEIHIFECGYMAEDGSVCHFAERRISRGAAEFALEQHIRTAHRRRFDPDHPSTTVMGWIYPDPPQRTQGHWLGGRRVRG